MKKIWLLIVSGFICMSEIIQPLDLSKIKILPFEEQDAEKAFEMICFTVDTTHIAPIPESEEGKTEWYKDMRQEFQDLPNFEKMYFGKSGSFLSMFYDGELIGIGGFKKINEGVCELKRVFLHPNYHGHGLGKLLVQELMKQAKNYQYHTYHTIRLEIYNPPIQQIAIGLYKKLGFYEIEKYHEKTDCELFMEKKL